MTHLLGYKVAMRGISLIIILISQFNTPSVAQSRRPFSSSDYKNILYMADCGVSDGGRFIWYRVSPMQYGDPYIVVRNMKTEQIDTFPRGGRIIFGSNEDWLAYVRHPVFNEVRQARFNDPEASDHFDDTLVVIHFRSGSNRREYQYGGLHELVTPSEVDGKFVTALLKSGNIVIPGDSLPGSECETTGKSDRQKNKPGTNKTQSHRLLILDPATGSEITEERVQLLAVSPFGNRYAWISRPEDTIPADMLWFFDTQDQVVIPGYLSSGDLSQAVFSYDENQLALIEKPDSTIADKLQLLWHRDLGGSEHFKTVSSPVGMTFNTHHAPFFLSRNNRLVTPLSYSTSKLKSDSLLKEERYQLDIWSWDDPYIQPQQLKLAEREHKHPYYALAHPDMDTVTPIETREIRTSGLSKHATNQRVLLWDESPYLIERTWMGSVRRDVSILDLNTMERKPVLPAIEGSVFLSPDEQYILWYKRTDSAWFGMSISDSVVFCITCNTPAIFYSADYDRVGPAHSCGLAGWGDGGRSVLINSRYDIWRFDLERQIAPVCLTSQSNNNDSVVFRYIKTDPKKMTLEKRDLMLLSTFHRIRKDGGLARIRYDKPGESQRLFSGPYHISRIQQSKNGDRFIYHRESFQEFPELWASDRDFRKTLSLSDLGEQYDQFHSGSVELVRWKGADGEQYEGKLYLPAHRTMGDGLPMIVYFYERGSDHLHRFSPYTPSRSVINKRHYLSHGYAIFEPDIHYAIGAPGEDALRAVLSGTRHILKMGFIDSTRLGIQGQSWGGYQVAYIITQTHLFKAAMAGAAVSNMTSAYGAIRWESGMPRLFQYEQGQSRLGLNLWDTAGFQRYYNNSPLFFADRIHTPLLMMHNDNDGAVPWSQSVELYLALRRMGRPSWLLVYNNEAHNLRNWANRVDLSIRMKQFFDHYLLDAPAPAWMVKGRPALFKETEDRYELQH